MNAKLRLVFLCIVFAMSNEAHSAADSDVTKAPYKVSCSDLDTSTNLEDSPYAPRNLNEPCKLGDLKLPGLPDISINGKFNFDACKLLKHYTSETIDQVNDQVQAEVGEILAPIEVTDEQINDRWRQMNDQTGGGVEVPDVEVSPGNRPTTPVTTPGTNPGGSRPNEQPKPVSKPQQIVKPASQSQRQETQNPATPPVKKQERSAVQCLYGGC